MHIFLTNDDGAGAKGILALAKAAEKRGHHVTMVAPKVQQSAMSHRFTLDKPLFMAQYPVPYENCDSYTVDGSPSDCVRVGLHALVKGKPDVLISGINNGFNAGIATHYSGTVGAAMEGAFHYLPSIAVSTHHQSSQELIDALADYTIRKAEELQGKELPRASILNINAPKEMWKGEVYCPLGTSYFHDSYERRESPRAGSYYWLDDSGTIEEP